MGLDSRDAALTNALERATRIVAASKVPDDLRTTAFAQILTELLADSEAGTGSDMSFNKRRAVGQESPAQGLASLLHLSLELVADVYQANDDGTFSVHVPTSKLSKAKASATKELALLIMAGRQAVAEEWTQGDEIIRVLQHYSKFDSANNASNMKEGEVYWMVSGSGRSRKYKLRKTGWEAAADLVKKIAEG